MRDFSGKKAKQYLRNSAASRVQRKCVSSLTDSTDARITTSINLRHTVAGDTVQLRHKPNLAISPPSDFRLVTSALISSPADFRHVQSSNFSNQIGGFGTGSLRASVRVEPIAPSSPTDTTGSSSSCLSVQDSMHNT